MGSGRGILGLEMKAFGEAPKAIGLGNHCCVPLPNPRIGAGRLNFLQSPCLACKQLPGGKGAAWTDRATHPWVWTLPRRRPQQTRARAESAKRLGVSLLSRATRRRLRAPSGAVEGSGSHEWRVGRGRAARLGAHRSQGWRRLQRGEGLPLPGKLAALGADFGLRARFSSGGRARPPR